MIAIYRFKCTIKGNQLDPYPLKRSHETAKKDNKCGKNTKIETLKISMKTKCMIARAYFDKNNVLG